MSGVVVLNPVRISSSAVLPLPSGAATELTLLSVKDKITDTIKISSTAVLPVSGPLTNEQLRALAVNTKLSSSAILLVSQSGIWNINNISGTISLPTGAATATNQTTTNGILNTIDTDIKAIQPRKTVNGSGTEIKINNDGTQTVVLSSTGNSIKLKDGVGNNITSSSAGTKQPLHILMLSSTGTINDPSKIKILDASGTNLLKVNPDGSINVNTASPSPPNTIPVLWQIEGSVAGSTSSDTAFKIPNNSTLYLQRFKYGAYGSTSNENRIYLYYDATNAVIDSTATLLSTNYLISSSFYDDIAETIAGNTTNYIIIRRQRADATARWLFGTVFGYLTYNTITTNETGTSPTVTATTFTKDAGVTWTANQHAGRYVRINGRSPLQIISNTTTTATIQGNIAVIGATVPYQIITFNP